jgi:hypothetical protein
MTTLRLPYQAEQSVPTGFIAPAGADVAAALHNWLLDVATSASPAFNAYSCHC